MTIDQRDRDACYYPPHPDLPDREQAQQLASESAPRRFSRWVRHAPAERLPLVATPIVWTASEILHAAGVSGLLPGMATVAATGVAYGLGERRSRNPEHKQLRAAEMAAVTGTAGAWLTAATTWGPLAGPDHLLSVVYGLGAAGGYWWLRHHEAVRAARSRRDAAAKWAARKAWWHALAPHLGLQGSHLLSGKDTYLGESLLIDTRGTGKRASHLANDDLAERIAEIEMLPPGRIDVTTDRLAGRLRISIRRDDPWAEPILHPLTDPGSKYAKYVPVPASIRDPLTIGVDPETGKPLQVQMWTKEGGRVILIAGKKAAGKTVLLNNLTERITACPDARLLTINLAKVLEDDIWSPLTEASALGELGRARRILAFSQDGIMARSKPPAGVPRRRTAVHQPTPAEPLFVVKVDEIDAVASDDTCKTALSFIASKCRSEGWTLMIAGQRATAAWMGGANLRANLDVVIYGKFSRAGETRHAGGGEVELRDMGRYGEGASGVFGIIELGDGGGEPEKGRTFLLSEPGDLEAIVAERLRTYRPYELEPALGGLAEAWAKITRRALPDDPDGDLEDASGDTPRQAFVGDDDDDESESESDRLDARGARAKLGGARAAGTVPGASPLDDENEQKIAEWTRRRGSELPAVDQNALRGLLGRPGGVSTREAAAATPGGWSHTQVHQQFMRWQSEGTVEIHGRGPARRFHAAAAPAVPTGPYLHAVPDPPAAAESTGDGHGQ